MTKPIDLDRLERDWAVDDVALALIAEVRRLREWSTDDEVQQWRGAYDLMEQERDRWRQDFEDCLDSEQKTTEALEKALDERDRLRAALEGCMNQLRAASFACTANGWNTEAGACDHWAEHARKALGKEQGCCGSSSGSITDDTCR